MTINERLKAEAESKAKAEAESAAEKARVEAENKAAEEAKHAAAAAPDKEKLVAFAAAVRQLVIPGMDNDEVYDLIVAQAQKFAAWVESLEEKL